MCFFQFFRKNTTVHILCPICLEILNGYKNVIVALNCGRILCLKCTKHFLSFNVLSKNLEISNLYSELNKQQISCPLCRLSKYGNFIYFKEPQCMICYRSLNNLLLNNKNVYHLNCGHICCERCLYKNIYKNTKIKCLQCLDYFKFFPLYL